MNQENEMMERIESYLEGRLDDAAKAQFEQEMAADPSFAAKVASHAQVIQALRSYGQRMQMKQELGRIHSEIQAEGREKGKVIPLWKKYYPTAAVAAAVSAVMVITLLTTTEFWIGWRKPKAVYKELKRDLEKIQRAQQAIIKDIKSKDDTQEYNPGKYGGTGFAISPEGYLVTSYHLIKDAAQLVIENSKGQVYKVRSFYADPTHDLAILKVEDSTFRSFGPIPYPLRSGEADLGERIFTLGFPKEDIVFGEGSISSKSGYEDDTVAYQVSVPVNPGNSGGPVFDDNGSLVAVISGKQLNTDGAAFAIKAEYLLETINGIPKDSLKAPFKFPRNSLMGKNRVKQLKTIRDLVFIVKVYN
jgi:serine protease Do